MVAWPDVMLLGGGIGAGGGGGGGRVGPGDIERMGESSSVNKSRMLSSREGSSLVPRSLEKPDATSSSCCTGCLGSNGKKNLFSEPPSLLEAEVEALVLLDMTTVACGIAEAIEVVSWPFVVVVVVVATNPVEALKTTDAEFGVDAVA